MKYADLESRLEATCFYEPNTGCRLFGGALSPKGYPIACIDGKTVRLTRAVLERRLGRKLLPRELACHRCDTPSCCEETHLFVGSNQDNVRDKCAKGRAAPPPHGPRKLDTDRAGAVREARALGLPVRLTARLAGISERQVERIAAGTRWAS